MTSVDKRQYIITGVLSLLTGVIASIATLYVGVGSNNIQEKSLTDAQTEYLIEQLSRNYEFELTQRKALQAVVTPLQTKVTDLENKVDLLVNTGIRIPFPHWLKSTDGRMLALNNEYERIFLKPRGLSKGDYIGHLDNAVWSNEYAEKFQAIDKTVLSTGGVWIGQEWVIVNDSAQKWQIVKYPVRIGGSMVGIGGFAIPPKNSMYFPVIGDAMKPEETKEVKQIFEHQ